jgi:hypothetical protein
VNDIERTVDELTERGVNIERYNERSITTDEKGLATFEGGAKVAYFRNPDGNTLSTLKVRVSYCCRDAILNSRDR